ncbi:hypothetical protein [Cupriavidus sp. DL-D2]|uniref:hypothetical protein n=1 Tax=Cupriavidus sp. DL-D2 TaxID=3144974 RepID=UPI00321568D0
MPSKVILANGNPFVLALMDALGLPKSTKSFELRCALDEVVTVRCTYLPQAEGVEGFDAHPLVAEYKLVPAGAATAGDPAEAFTDDAPGDTVKVVQHINVEPRADVAVIAQAMRHANLGSPLVPQPRPTRSEAAISGAALGWGIFGMACVGVALTYALGLWP